MNEGDYWTILLIDAAAPGDWHFLDNGSDALCEAVLTDTPADWAHQ